jgi:outer membrane receptor protein involved in Fe transport
VKRLSPIIAAAILLSQASVADARARHRLSVPGGTLGDAVVALGRQAGISIGIADPLLSLQRVAPLNGTFTVEQALQRLLRGTGGRSIAVDRSTFRIVRNSPPGLRIARRETPNPRPAPSPLPPEEPQPDIVITGTKRPVLLAAYPGSASLIDGEELSTEAGLRGSEALSSRLPFVTSTHLGAGRNKLFLRGIADSSFNGPTQATVGQYLGETRLNYNAPDPDLRLYDIERVEILAGPQGTLYGAGSLGGIIRVIPNAPRLDLFEAGASIGGALTRSGGPSYDGAAMLNLPLVEDRLGLRLVGYGASEGGYIDDVLRGRDDVNRTDIVGGRASIRADVAGGWTIDLGGVVQHIDGEAQYADRDLPPLTRDSAVDEEFSNLYALGELVVARQWDNFSFVSSTGIVRQVLRERYDSTRNGGPPRVFDQENRITLLSAESRLSRQADDGSGWLIGASFLRNESEQSRALGPPQAPLPITGVRNAVSEATLYGEGTIPLADWLSATAGARLTHSRLSGSALDPPVAFIPLLATLRAQANRSETAFLPSLALAARPAANLLLFARYQEGFRPGGLAVSGDFVQRFRSDRVSTFEAGARYGRPRAGLFDAALSFAYTRWRNVQADIVTMDGFPTTANIGDGRIYSLDLRAGWRPLAGVHVEASGTFNDSLVTNPAPSIILDPASPLPNVARYNGRLGVDYETAISDGVDLRLAAAARYVGRSRLGIGAIFGEPQGDWLDLTAGARLELQRHAITLGVTNLLDANGNRFALGSPFTLVEDPQVTPLRPRTVRLGWEVRF